MNGVEHQERLNIFDRLGPIPARKEAAAMSFHFINVKVKEWLTLFGPFTAAFVIGIFIRFLYPTSWFLSDSFYVLADALMVAGIIGGLFELFSTKFMIERVADDLAQRLVGRGLPKEVQAHILEITKTEFVWSNYVKRYALSLSDGKMQLQCEVTFEVRNYSDLTKKYSPVLAEESFYSPDFVYVEYGVNEDTPRVFSGQALKEKTTITSDSRVKKACDFPTIDLPPVVDGAFVKVLMRYRVTMPLEYTDLNHFKGATTGVSIILSSIPTGFDFSAEGEGVNHAANSDCWGFIGPFVGRQHVRVRWFKKPEISN